MPTHPNLYCNEEMGLEGIANKSYDATQSKIKKRVKRKRAKTAARPSLIHRDKDSLITDFKRQLLTNLMAKEDERHCPAPLFKHEVTSKMRSRMVDWMIECFAIFRKSSETYFLSVYALDEFLTKADTIYEDKDVHLLGLSCIFMASKYSDVQPICLDDVAEKIGHDTFGPNVIKNNETGIIKTFEWDLDIITPIHFIDHIMMLLRSELTQGYDYIFDDLEKAAVQHAKMVVLDHRMMEFKPSEIAIGCFSSACSLLFEQNGIGHTRRMEAVYGFFQHMLLEGVFNRDRSLKAVDRIKVFLDQYQTEFQFCPNALKFSLIDGTDV